MDIMKLKYGNGVVEINLSEVSCDVLAPKIPPPVENPEDRILQALETSTPSLKEAVGGAKEIVIIVPDQTRYSATEIYCPILTECIEKLPEKPGIKIAVANGLHRKPSADEIKKIIGAETAAKYEVIANDPKEFCKYDAVNEFPDGTPIEILKPVYNADKIIITGGVSLHYLAGFGGGRKALVPGVASLRTILGAHRLSLHPMPGMGRHANCKPANINENPMHDRLMAAQEFISPAYILNAIVSGDKKILDVFSGEPVKAFLLAAEKTKDLFLHKADKMYDVVIVSAGGSPKDIDFIQAHKALENVSYITKKGGAIFLTAQCAGGIGHDDFIGWFERGSSVDMDVALRNNFQVYGQTAVATRKKSEMFNINLKTELEDETLNKMGMKRFENSDDILNIIHSKDKPSVAVIPEGGTFCFMKNV